MKVLHILVQLKKKLSLLSKSKVLILVKLLYWIFTRERRSRQSRIHYTKYTKSWPWTYRKLFKQTELLYEEIVDKTVPVSSTKIAEMAKILENIHRRCIGLVNELKVVADKMNIDINEVI